jgi:hypothetical protein
VGITVQVPKNEKGPIGTESDTEVGKMLTLLAASNAATLLWIIAAILVIAGIVTLIRGGVLAGIVLIVLGLLIGPGGVSIFDV